MRLAAATALATFSLASAFLIPNHRPQQILSRSSRLFADAVDNAEGAELDGRRGSLDKFDLDTALFCGGLAFDSYVEPPANSSRWERGVSSSQ